MTFIRNAIKYDFPIAECIESMLPVVDELIVNLGKSEDGTEKLIAELASRSPKIKIIHSLWDDSKTEKGLELSRQTNLALDACRGRWVLYLQADEAIHEREHALIRKAVEKADEQASPPDGLRFRYLHFYAGYSMIQRPWNWYANEIRIIRRSSGARSFGDAQTFRITAPNGSFQELRAPLIDTHVFHYGHARHPETMARKIDYFHRFWHGDNHGIKTPDHEAYSLKMKNLVWYWNGHPAPYLKRATQGLAWSVSPQKLHPTAFRQIDILTSTATHTIADELKSLIKKALPETRVNELGPNFSKLPDRIAPRDARVLVDLEAEQRTSLKSALFFPRALGFFAARIAHAPTGKLAPNRRAFYTAISWGGHENFGKGFVVPKPEYAKQLARWIGINPS